MKRRILPLILATVVVFTLFSCKTGAPVVSGGASSEAPAEEMVYYNGVFGIEVKLLQGWLIETLNEINLTEAAEDSGVVEELDVIEYDGGGIGLELCEFWSRENSGEQEHAGIMLYIESMPDMSIDAYTDSMAVIFEGDNSGYYVELLGISDETVGGNSYKKVSFKTTPPESSAVYIENYYVTEVDTCTYLVVYTTWWAGNAIGQADAMKAVEAVKVG